MFFWLTMNAKTAENSKQRQSMPCFAFLSHKRLAFFATLIQKYD